MRVRAVWISGFRSVLDNNRGHNVIIDLPKQDKGDDTGPTALELMAMSYVGCVATIFKIVADKRGLAFEDLEINLEAVKGEKTIERGAGKLIIKTTAKKEEVENALRLTLQVCPVGIIFDNAGIKIDWQVECVNIKS
ncbi:MAG: OsmC family protein [Nitrososphaerota archaeon]